MIAPQGTSRFIVKSCQKVQNQGLKSQRLWSLLGLITSQKDTPRKGTNGRWLPFVLKKEILAQEIKISISKRCLHSSAYFSLFHSSQDVRSAEVPTDG